MVPPKILPTKGVKTPLSAMVIPERERMQEHVNNRCPDPKDNFMDSTKENVSKEKLMEKENVKDNFSRFDNNRPAPRGHFRENGDLPESAKIALSLVLSAQDTGDRRYSVQPPRSLNNKEPSKFNTIADFYPLSNDPPSPVFHHSSSEASDPQSYDNEIHPVPSSESANESDNTEADSSTTAEIDQLPLTRNSTHLDSQANSEATASNAVPADQPTAPSSATSDSVNSLKVVKPNTRGDTRSKMPRSRAQRRRAYRKDSPQSSTSEATSPKRVSKAAMSPRKKRKQKQKRKKKAQDRMKKASTPRKSELFNHQPRKREVQSYCGSGGDKKQSKSRHTRKSRKERKKTLEQDACCRGAAMSRGEQNGDTSDSESDDQPDASSSKMEVSSSSEAVSSCIEIEHTSNNKDTVVKHKPRVTTGDMTQDLMQDDESESDAAVMVEGEPMSRVPSGDNLVEKDRASALDEDGTLQIHGPLPFPVSKQPPIPPIVPSNAENDPIQQPSTSDESLPAPMIFPRHRRMPGFQVFHWGMVEAIPLPQQPELVVDCLLPPPNRHHDNPSPLLPVVRLFTGTYPTDSPLVSHVSFLMNCCVSIVINYGVTATELPCLREVMSDLSRPGQAELIVRILHSLLEGYCKCQSAAFFGLDANTMLSCVKVNTRCYSDGGRTGGCQLEIDACHLVQGQNSIEFVASLKTVMQFFINQWKSSQQHSTDTSSEMVVCVTTLEEVVAAAKRAVEKSGQGGLCVEGALCVELGPLLAMLAGLLRRLC